MLTALLFTTVIVACIGVVIGIVSLIIGVTVGAVGFFVSIIVKLLPVIAIGLFLMMIFRLII